MSDHKPGGPVPKSTPVVVHPEDFPLIPNPLARPQAKVAEVSIAAALKASGDSFAERCWRCGYASPADRNPVPYLGWRWLFRRTKRGRK